MENAVTVLRVARVRTGLSLRAFAQQHDLSEVTLCNVERGKYYIPPAWREKLAKVLGISINELCDENGWPRLERVRAAS